MRAFITGITGFAGSHLAEHLLACGDQVLGCSTKGRWPAEAPPAIVQQADVIAWDVGCDEGLSAAAREQIERFAPNRIYHLAAISVPDLCGENDPTPEAKEVNIEGTRRVLEVARSLTTSPRVLCVSSSHVYAPVTFERYLVSEDSAIGPRRGYGITKMAAEEQARGAIERGLDVVIARAFQHTGPRQGPRMMLPEWISQFTKAGNAPIRVRTLDAYLDLTDVGDMVRAYRLLAEQGARGETYNVGSGICRRSGEILELVRGRLDPRRTIVETRPGHKQDPIAVTDRLAGLTGWQAKIPLERTVTDTIEFWLRRVERSALEREAPA